MGDDPHAWDLTPEQWAQFDRELREEFPEETQRFDEGMDSLRRMKDRPVIEYCQEYAYSGSKINICDAALGPDGRCPYERNHVDEED